MQCSSSIIMGTYYEKRLSALSTSSLVMFICISLRSPFSQAQDTEKKDDVKQTTIEEKPSTRSPAGAVWMSVGSTVLLSAVGGGLLAVQSDSAQVAGGILLGTGLIFGPSVGQWYSGRWGKATLFTLGRAAAVGLGYGGFLCMEIGAASDTGSGNSEGAGIAMLVIGGASLIALTVWDIVDSYSSAKKYNEEHAKKSISVSPFVMPSSSRNGENGMAYGLAVAGNF